MAFCKDCPIKGTEYCHKVNPKAKRYTRMEKESIRMEIEENKESNNGDMARTLSLR